MTWQPTNHNRHRDSLSEKYGRRWFDLAWAALGYVPHRWSGWWIIEKVIVHHALFRDPSPKAIEVSETNPMLSDLTRKADLYKPGPISNLGRGYGTR